MGEGEVGKENGEGMVERKMARINSHKTQHIWHLSLEVALWGIQPRVIGIHGFQKALSGTTFYRRQYASIFNSLQVIELQT